MLLGLFAGRRGMIQVLYASLLLLQFLSAWLRAGLDDVALTLGLFDSSCLDALAADHTERSVGRDASQYLGEVGMADVPLATVITLIRDDEFTGLHRCLLGKCVGDAWVAEPSFAYTSPEVLSF
jgi:hypothetical protein